MKLSLEVVADTLEQSCTLNSHIIPRSEPLLFKNILIGNSLLASEQNTIFVLKPEQLPADSMQLHPTNALIIVGGEDIGAQPFSYLQVKTEAHITDIFNIIQKLSSCLLQWGMELSNAVLEKRSLNTILKIGQKVLENEFCLQSPDYMIIAYTPHVQDYLNPFTYETSLHSFNTDKDILWRLHQYDEFRAFAGSHETKVMEIEGFKSLSKNLFIDNQCIARLVMPEGPRKVTPGFIQTYEYFGSIIKRALSSYALGEANIQIRRMRSCFANLLSAEHIRKKDILADLESYGWDPEDEYLCIVSDMERNGISKSYIDYMHLRASEELGKGCSVDFLFSDLIVTVINASLLDNIDARLTDLVSDNYLISGFSRHFSGIFKLPQAFKQASIALEMGMAQPHPGDGHYLFNDFAYSYLIKHSLSELPCNDLIPDGLGRLIEYDRKNSTEFFKTLAVFFEQNQSATASAAAMQIHRSTFLHRLERIKDISGCDFENYEECLYYAWCIALLEHAQA